MNGPAMKCPRCGAVLFGRDGVLECSRNSSEHGPFARTPGGRLRVAETLSEEEAADINRRIDELEEENQRAAYTWTPEAAARTSSIRGNGRKS